MKDSVLKHEIVISPGFAERSCALFKYRLPLLCHCYILSHEPSRPEETQEPSQLITFFIEQAERLAREHVGDPQAFMLTHNQTTSRTRSGWHVHVFIVHKRWEKTWAYTSLRNRVMAMLHALSDTTTPHACLTSHPAGEREFL